MHYIKKYRRYRKASIKLNTKIFRTQVSKEILLASMKALGLEGEGQTFVGDEGDLGNLMEFSIYELRGEDGKNGVERYAEKRGRVASATERQLLRAMRRAKTGLYKVRAVHASRSRLALVDLLEPGREILLTDINLSQGPVEGIIMFFRPLELDGLTMGTGTGSFFVPKMEAELLEAWERFEGREAERYAWFFTEGKRRGLGVEYAPA